MTEIILARSGQPTAVVEQNGQKVFLHSKYDPVLEAEKLVARWDSRHVETILVYGVGCGYHLRLLLQKMDSNQKLVVYECNQELLDVVTKAGILQDLYTDDRFQLRVCYDDSQWLRQFAGDLDIVDQGDGRFFIHPPSIKAIPKKLEKLKESLEEHRLRENSQNSQRQLLLDNLKLVWSTLHTFPNVGNGKGCFSELPAVIISAGPSLNEAIPWLRKLENRVLTLCVGTALQTLLQHDVRPNFAVVIEANAAVLQQFTNVTQNIPLIAYPSANADLTMGYKGPLIWAFPDGIEKLRNEAAKYNLPTIESGGSVATAALSIAHLFGCDPIIFVGQDLAYFEGDTHAKGTMHHNQGIPIPEQGPYWLITEAVGGGSIQTTRGWNVYRKWIESFIGRHPKHRYFNASKGARIHGAKETTLEQLLIDGIFLRTYDFDERIKQIFS